jgi:preprotein translocase subunit SecD
MAHNSIVKRRVGSFFILLFGLIFGLFIHYSQPDPSGTHNGFLSRFPFKLGLDLNGGTHLVYRADTSKIAATDVNDAMQSLRDVINARINGLGVSEPIIQTEKTTINGQEIQKLIVELPGVTDVKQAVDTIGQTPVLEFKKLNPNAAPLTASSTPEDVANNFLATELTGRYLNAATVQYDSQTNRPIVSLEFDDTGKELFANLTKEEIGKPIAIFLDGKIISAPTVQDEIRDGKAVITGSYSATEARDLARSLRYGALPVPVELIGTQTIGASLGADAIAASITAGIWGFIAISIFLIIWYRLPGLVAVVALILYVIINFTLFKLLGVVLTSAGLAAFIISLGMAVDGNILIFERMREEFERGSEKNKTLEDGIREGFSRAWLSIRDSNLSSIITGAILFFTATSALVKGFAFVFIIGVLVSAFTAITISRTLLLSLSRGHYSGKRKILFGHGLKFSSKPKSN